MAVRAPGSSATARLPATSRLGDRPLAVIWRDPQVQTATIDLLR